MYSGRTTHYGLPIYAGTDTVNLLEVLNDTNETVDTAIFNTAQLATSASDAASAATTAASEANATATGAANAVSTLNTQVAANTGAITTLNASVNRIDGDIDTLEGKVATLESTTGDLGTLAGSETLTTTAQTLTGAINELDDDIDDVNTLLGSATLDTTAQTITGAINELAAGGSGGSTAWTQLGIVSASGGTGTTNSEVLTNLDLSGYNEIMVAVASDTNASTLVASTTNPKVSDGTRTYYVTGTSNGVSAIVEGKFVKSTSTLSIDMKLVSGTVELFAILFAR